MTQQQQKLELAAKVMSGAGHGAAASKTAAEGRRYALDVGATRRLIRRFSSHLQAHRPALALGLLCTLGVAAAEIVKPWPIKIIFDGVLVPAVHPGMLVAELQEWTGGGNLLLATACLLILAVALVGGLFSFGQTFFVGSVGQKVVASIRVELYRHIQRLSQSFHDNSSTGDLLSRLTGDVRQMQDVLVNSSVFLFARSAVILGAIIVMLVLDWRLTLVALAVLPLLFLISLRYGSEIKIAARKQRRNESRIAHVMAESLSAIKVVQAYSREAYEEQRFSDRNQTSLEAGLRTTRLEAYLDRIVQLLLAAGTCAVVWYGVTRVQAGAMTPGDLLVFLAYLASLHKPISRIAAQMGRIAKATACGERIVAILDLEPDVRDAPDAIAAGPLKGELSLENVSFGYAPGQDVLTGASLTIRAGELVAFMSESGSGKSTIAHLLLRFYDPREGRITIDSHDLRRLSLGALRDQVALLLQESVLFNASIRENIAYGKLDATDEEIVEAARTAQAHDFIMRLPEGYDTIVGERGATLSGGQRQRVAIARVLIKNAPVIILDEPLAGLDETNEKSVQGAIARLISGRTCIIITHDRATAAMADRVFAIAEGRIVEVDRRESSALQDAATVGQLQ